MNKEEGLKGFFEETGKDFDIEKAMWEDPRLKEDLDRQTLEVIKPLIAKMFKEKYSYLTCAEIKALNKTDKNCSFSEWYEALQSYVDHLGNDWERKLITDAGEECWKELYEFGHEVSEALAEGFRE